MTSGGDHPNTLTSQHSLALVLRDRGRLDAAEPEFRSVLEARRRLLGDEHPDTLNSQRELMDVLSRVATIVDRSGRPPRPPQPG